MSWAYFAETTHRRFASRARPFHYRLFYLFLDIDRVEEAAKPARLFSYNGFNLFSFHERDHGNRNGASLRPWAVDAFASIGVDVTGGRIMLLALPRVLGFVFNPLSVFFGYGADGKLRGVLYEVCNTFGEMHLYAAPAADGASAQAVDKAFHVSPFFPVCGGYRFALEAPGEHLSLAVHNVDRGARTHVATLTGERAALSDRTLLKAFLTLPMMTVGVVAAIHWQALKLWLRGARYHRKPPAPDRPISPATLAIAPSESSVN